MTTATKNGKAHVASLQKIVETAGEQTVAISPPNFGVAKFHIIGVAPFVQLRFGEKAKNLMRNKMLAGQKAKKGAKRDPRDFDDDYQQTMYRAAPAINPIVKDTTSEGGWRGIPASSFRNAAISACRIVSFKMTLAKLSLFIEADGYDEIDGTPLVRITKGEPHKVEHTVRNATGVPDIRVRAMWNQWEADVRVRFDADQFSLADVSNLMSRVGMQVGIGEGRPDSKDSAGMGWGLFRISE